LAAEEAREEAKKQGRQESEKKNVVLDAMNGED
jgi:hypothetical protein